MHLIRTDCLAFVRLQDGPRSLLPCCLHEFAVEIFNWHQKVIGLNLARMSSFALKLPVLIHQDSLFG